MRKDQTEIQSYAGIQCITMKPICEHPNRSSVAQLIAVYNQIVAYVLVLPCYVKGTEQERSQ